MKQIFWLLWDVLVCLPRHLWNQRLRFRSIMDTVHIPEMDAHSLECYTHKMWYELGETIEVYYQSPSENTRIEISRLVDAGRFSLEFATEVGRLEQQEPTDPALGGCKWKHPFTLSLQDHSLEPGYYRLKMSTEVQEYVQSFLVGKRSKAGIAVFSPVSTWVAYNPYGGKSLYKNFKDDTTVHCVSALRPNTAVQYKDRFAIHDIQVEANIYRWCNAQFGADLFPDYALEQGEAAFDSYKVLIIAYHMEYASPEMLRTLRRLQKQGKTLVFLGANQLYWKVRWKEDYTQLECHKDYKPWKDRLGGMWRHSLRHEAAMQGVAFSDAGTYTYAPYRVEDPAHWVFGGLKLRKGDLFGMHGINALPVCGDETDKLNPRTPHGFACIAHGINSDTCDKIYCWPDQKVTWNGSGGGDFVVKTGKRAGILATGSIQSGSALGVDEVFTTAIHTFISRYLNG
jgi:hypothetical protein